MPAGRAAPLAESGLPSGGPAGRGLPLDPRIPGEKTFGGPPEGHRDPDKGRDESIYRVDQPDDLLKDQTVPDSRDHSRFKVEEGGAGENVSDKTKYPYRDDHPNAHNASACRLVARLYGYGCPQHAPMKKG